MGWLKIWEPEVIRKVCFCSHHKIYHQNRPKNLTRPWTELDEGLRKLEDWCNLDKEIQYLYRCYHHINHTWGWYKYSKLLSRLILHRSSHRQKDLLVLEWGIWKLTIKLSWQKLLQIICLSDSTTKNLHQDSSVLQRSKWRVEWIVFMTILSHWVT